MKTLRDLLPSFVPSIHRSLARVDKAGSAPQVSRAFTIWLPSWEAPSRTNWYHSTNPVPSVIFNYRHGDRETWYQERNILRHGFSRTIRSYYPS